MVTPPDSIRVLFVTLPPTQAEPFVQALVEARVVACGNILAGRSIYRWEGALCREDEAVVLLETTADALEDAMAHIAAAHPYDCPKIIALEPVAVAAAYAAWVHAELGGRSHTA
jgi:periplasmic divalent cation tolerance protein